MLIKLENFGGILPKMKDLYALPQNKAQEALNCRFDLGGIAPYNKDSDVITPTHSGTLLSLFKYYDDNDNAWYFAWDSDVDALKVPLPGDTYNRVFYAESGVLKVTDEDLYDRKGSQLIVSWTNGSPGYDTFTSSSSKDIASAINTAGTSESGSTASITIVSGKTYRIIANLTLNSGQAPTLSFTNPATSQALSNGENIIEFTASSTSTVLTMTNTLASNWSCTFTLYNTDTNYPETYLYPSPPAPVSAPVANVTYQVGQVLKVTIENETTSESDGTYNLIFSDEGSGTGVAGTYTVISNKITTISLSNNGSGYTYNPTVVTQSGTGTLKATIGDPTLLETRGWVYTYVNSYGQEGPPSPVSNLIDMYDGDTATISSISVSGVNSLYDVTHINIYRLNQSLSSAQYQFVAQITSSTTSYTDSMTNAQLSEILQSSEWDGPPSGISGLVALPNGVVAGFVGNLVCFSVPKYPHAWPVSYQKPTDRDIIGLSNIDTLVIVITKGVPYAVVCNDPSNAVMEKIEGGISGISKRSIVAIPTLGMVAYASPEGIMTISKTNGPKLATGGMFTRKQWNDMYNPSTISAYYWEGKYIGFYTNGSNYAGFMLDLASGEWVDIDLYATAGYHDPVDGKLYLIVDGDIVVFSDSDELRDYSWLSKRFLIQPTSFNWIKVVGSEYPTRVDFILRNIPRTLSVDVEDVNPVRFKGTGLISEFELRLSGQSQVSGIYISTTLEEMPL